MYEVVKEKYAVKKEDDFGNEAHSVRCNRT